MASRKPTPSQRRNAKQSTAPRASEAPLGELAGEFAPTPTLGQPRGRPVLSDEEQSEYEALRVRLHGELGAGGAVERLLVERIAGVQWRLARIPALERDLFEALRRGAGGEAETLGAAWLRDGGERDGALSRLARYETLLERSLSRLLGELRRVQAGRRDKEARFDPLAAHERSGGLGGDVPPRLQNEANFGRGRVPLTQIGFGDGLALPRRLKAPAFHALAPALRRCRVGR